MPKLVRTVSGINHLVGTRAYGACNMPECQAANVENGRCYAECCSGGVQVTDHTHVVALDSASGNQVKR